MFDNADYERAAARLDVPAANIMAMAAVESSGETFWAVDGKLVVPVRFEAHWFGKLTDYRFNDTHPDLSCVSWNPGLAARTRAGAWDQLNRARALDRDAADQSASHGAFQVMGMHWKRLGYPSVRAFVDSMSADGDDGQMDAFTRFIEADPALHASLALGAWLDVEQRYNGGGYGGAYAAKLRAAAAIFGGQNSPAAPRPMRKGDRGVDVTALQSALGIRADGDFGPETDAAVRLFQVDRGLSVDGVAGALTIAALGGLGTAK
ncbi:MAG: N-acetylmuramidase domain-containing protein [Bradyrhizobium sp.]